jgi:hypothetical protein
MLKKALKILGVPVLVVASVVAFIGHNNSFADNNKQQQKDNAPMPTCYEPMPPAVIDSYTVKELEQQLKELKEMYKNDKISHDVYKTRKKEITKRIRDMNAVNESINMVEDEEIEIERETIEGEDNIYY